MCSLNRKVALLGLSFFAVLGAQDSLAVTNAQAPNSTLPGLVERQISPIPQDKVEKIDMARPVDMSDEITPEKAKAIRFVLRDAVIEGNTVFNGYTLKSMFAGKIGKEITLAELYKIRDELTAHYRNKGYVLSRAVLPPQEIAAGIPVIRIVEGYVAHVNFEGDSGGDRDLLECYAKKIMAERPLRIQTLERYMMLMNELAGVKAKSVLTRSDAPGAADLTVKLKHKMVTAFVGVDNYGTRFVGPYQANAGVKLNSIFGYYDQTMLRINGAVPRTKELMHADLSHSFPIGCDGMQVSLTGGYTNSKPGHFLKQLGNHSFSRSFAAELSYPVLRTRPQSATVYGRFNYLDADLKNFFDKLYSDRLRSLTLGGRWDAVDSMDGMNSFDLSGTHSLKDSKRRKSSREEAAPQYFKANFNASRLQRVDDHWNVFGAVATQYTTLPMFASEEMAFGGQSFGRGFDSSEITGDYGVMGKLELQYNNTVNVDWFKDYQVFAFCDGGIIYNNDSGANATNDPRAERAVSIGLGTRVNFTKEFAGSIEVAKPINRDVNSVRHRHPRVFFTLSAKF